MDPVNQPMGGADVTVTELRSHRVAARGATGPYGFFMAVLPPGDCSLLVVAEGLEPQRETVAVMADTGPTIQLELDVQATYRTRDTPTPPG